MYKIMGYAFEWIWHSVCGPKRNQRISHNISTSWCPTTRKSPPNHKIPWWFHYDCHNIFKMAIVFWWLLHTKWTRGRYLACKTSMRLHPEVIQDILHLYQQHREVWSINLWASFGYPMKDNIITGLRWFSTCHQIGKWWISVKGWQVTSLW